MRTVGSLRTSSSYNVFLKTAFSVIMILLISECDISSYWIMNCCKSAGVISVVGVSPNSGKR